MSGRSEQRLGHAAIHLSGDLIPQSDLSLPSRNRQVTSETITTLLDLLSESDYGLKRMAIFQIGEIWLAGRDAGDRVLTLLPRIADTNDEEIHCALIHAIDKLVVTRRYGATDQSVPVAIVECLETMVSVPKEGWHTDRARRLLEMIAQKKPFDLHS